MKIGELSAATGVSRDALRLYERRGLIRADRRDNGYRDYPETAETLVGIIRQAQALGFTLAEIGEITASLSSGHLGSDAIAALLRDKIALLDARLQQMTDLRALLLDRLETACPLQLTPSAESGPSSSNPATPGSR